MTVIIACDFEGAGPAGTTLSNGNTGGTMTVGASATAISTASPVGLGLLAGQYAVPATNVSSRTLWSVASGTLTFAVSFKFHIASAFATTKRIMSLINTSATTIMSVNLNGSTGQFQIQDAAGATTVTASDNWAAGVTYRVEMIGVISTSTTGDFTVNYYVGDETTPVNVTPMTRTNYNMGTAALGSLQGGITANGTSVAATVVIDSVRYEVGGTTEIGPEFVLGDVSGATVNDGTVAGSVAATGNVVGAVTAGGTVTGSVGKVGNATGAVTAGGAVTGSVGKVGNVSGAVTAGGTVTGSLGTSGLTGDVAGSVTAGGTAVARVGKIGSVTGAVVAGGTVSGLVGKLSTVSGAVTASGVVTPGTLGRFGAVIGATTIGGTVTGVVARTATATGVTTVGGTITGSVLTGFEVTRAYAVAGTQSAVPSAYSGIASAPTSTGG